MAWWAGRGSRRNRRATFSWPTSPSGSTTPDTCLRPRAREFSKRSRLLPPRKSRIRSRYTMQAGAGGGTGSPGGSGQGARCLENERARSLSAAPGSGARLVLVATPPRQRQGPARASPDTCGGVRAGVPHGTWHALTWSAAYPQQPRHATQRSYQLWRCGHRVLTLSPPRVHHHGPFFPSPPSSLGIRT